MKRVVFIILMLLASLALANEHQEFVLKTAAGDTIWSIPADTLSVYSSEFDYTPDLSIHYVTWDTTGGAANDSVQFYLELQTKGLSFASARGWVTVARDTITTDSTHGYWQVPNTASNGRERRLKITGGSDNCDKGFSFGKFEVKGYKP